MEEVAPKYPSVCQKHVYFDNTECDLLDNAVAQHDLDSIRNFDTFVYLLGLGMVCTCSAI